MDSCSTSTSTPYTISDAKVTVRSRLECINKIRGLLNTNRTTLFRKTVFGPWLDIPPFSADVHLLNYFYQREVNADVSEECPSLRFKIGDNVLEFGREQFCLITGFLFGPIAKEETNVGSLVHGLEHSPFFDRLFPENKNRKTKKIKGEQLLALMSPGKVWDGLSDEDAVRVCLLVMATCVFIGREGRFYIPDHLLAMIENFDVWNSYPWGEYMWIHLYKRTVNVVKRHIEGKTKKPGKKSRNNKAEAKKNGKESPTNEAEAKNPGKKSPNKEQTYNLYGFVWALKIWILETFPNSVQFWSKDSTKTPRGLAWSKFNNFEKKHYPILFDPGFKPLEKLVLRNDEVVCPWYTRSMDYIKGLHLKLVVATPLLTEPLNVGGQGIDAAENIGNEVPGVLYIDGSVLYGDSPTGRDADGDEDCGRRGYSNVHGDGHGVTGNCVGGTGSYSEEVQTAKERSVFVNEHLVEGNTVLDAAKDHMQNEVDVIKSSVVSIEERVGDVDVKELYRELDVVKRRIQVIENVLQIDNSEESTCIRRNPSDRKCEEKPEESTFCRENDKAKDIGGENKDFCPDLLADTPVNPSVIEPEVQNFLYTDTEGYTGPMTQVVKGICPVQSDPVEHLIEMEHTNSFDCGSLPNLNAAFSEFCDEGINLTPHADMMDMVVDDSKTAIQQELPRDHVSGKTEDMGNEIGDTQQEPSRVLPNMDKPEESSFDLSKASQELSGEVDKPKEPAADVDEVICIDVEVENDNLQVPNTFPADVNVVLVNNVRSIFNANKRKRKTGKYNNSPYTNLPATTPRVLRRRSYRNKYKKISPPKAPDFDKPLELPPLEPFTENLERGPKAKRTEVNVPDAIKNFVETKMDIKFMFPWGSEDTLADVRFWKCLLAMDDCSSGWLRDEHLDVWVDLMWTFRPADADWAMAGTFFCPAVMGNMLRPYWANSIKYPVPWADVEKVLFPINEPGVHWATGELQLRTGVVTVFDSLRKFTKKRDWWNITMRAAFEKYLVKYLKDEGVLEAKGIQADGYALSWKQGKDVPNQGYSYGDCGVWVCINLYRLAHNMPLKVNKPLSVCLAYRERMAEYFWKYKILYSQPKTLHDQKLV